MQMHQIKNSKSSTQLLTTGNAAKNYYSKFITDSKPRLKPCSSYSKNQKNSSANADIFANLKIKSQKVSLKQLLNFINELYESKKTYDKKCVERRLPKETLEQYMYTYLNNKFGLRKLAIGYASGIVRSIREHACKSSEVCLFLKILRNELEEESQRVFTKLKVTVSDILTYYHQTKNPLKTDSVIKEYVRKDKASFLEEEVWRTVINFLFPHDNTENVIQKIRKFIEVANEENQKYIEMNIVNNPKKLVKMTRKEIREVKNKGNGMNLLYNDLIEILLQVQMSLRSNYLSKFAKGFRAIDSDDDGIVNQDEFASLIKGFRVYESDEEDSIENLLDKIDPFDTNVITFSDIVDLLSNEFYEGTQTLIMDKIAEYENVK